jgi:enhancing lycopene biosynthesis protein 2
MKPVALILSGCGRADGSEIHESVSVLLALSQHDMPVKIYAPDIEQFRVIDHLSGRMLDEKRNVLAEAARIARGKISPLSELDTAQTSAIILPGGIGASANLCTYAQDGIHCEVEKDVFRVLSIAMKQHLPLGFICIAPVLAARVASELGLSLTLTIGDDPDTAGDIEALGCVHKVSDVHECVVDNRHKVVSTAAYMSAKNPAECFAGISGLIKAIKILIEK